jgi:hypothetical protein
MSSSGALACWFAWRLRCTAPPCGGAGCGRSLRGHPRLPPHGDHVDRVARVRESDSKSAHTSDARARPARRRAEPARLEPAVIQAGRRRGVLVAAFQSEREEETRDRAERGSVVRGSDQVSVAAKRAPRRLTSATIQNRPKTLGRRGSDCSTRALSDGRGGAAFRP